MQDAADDSASQPTTSAATALRWSAATSTAKRPVASELLKPLSATASCAQQSAQTKRPTALRPGATQPATMGSRTCTIALFAAFCGAFFAEL